MSVHITVKVPADTEIFQKSLIDRADEVASVAEKAKAVGALHHRFALGPDYVVVIDEWETAEQFQAFFGAPELQTFIASVGGDVTQEPQMIIGEAIDSPDRF